MKLTNCVVGLLTAGLLAGCATSSDVRHAELEAGISQDFNALHTEVQQLALESILELNVNVKSAGMIDDVYTIEFSKPVSAFSWGEVGRVAVVDLNPRSRVVVLSEKRLRYQVTGISEAQFAEAIFEGIERRLD